MRKLPAYPLFVKDPFFSIWSAGDILNQSNTVFWHGENKPFYGTIIVDGQEYIFLGKREGAQPLKQIDLNLTAFSTNYLFAEENFDLQVEFISPLPPNNIDLASCPVCFMKYTFIPKRRFQSVIIQLTAHEQLCYNNCYQEGRKKTVRGGVMRFENFESAYFGLLRQMPLSHSSDEFAADWGYYYLAGKECEYYHKDYFGYICACDKHICVESSVSGYFLVAFDDLASVYYFGDFLKSYYFCDGKSISDALRECYHDADIIFQECAKFDKELREQALKYGEEYLLLLYASLRQSMAAHKIVQDKAGRILFLSKECNSDGCIATVDVSYPSAPLYLLYNPELINGMLRPIFDFARMPVWEFDFAPHDAGIYPYCMGQFYGALNQKNKYNSDIGMTDWHSPESLPLYYLYPAGSKLYARERQMPIEECGNMLILSASASNAGAGETILYENFDLLQKWADYLCENGLSPDNQLCTDDFAGHLANNANLSLKACFGIVSFAVICERTGHSALSAYYMDKARKHAAEWLKLCFDGKRFTPLTIGGDPQSYSLKYNLIFDKLYGTHLFPQKLFDTEIQKYLAEQNKFGTPLDNRASYTKSDWLVWAAALSEDKSILKQMIAPIVAFLKESPDRVPFADWFDSKSGKNQLFRNRTVQGALFILLLLDTNKLKISNPLVGDE